MQVVKNSVVTLNYRVTNPAGELVDDGQEPWSTSTAATTTSFPSSRKLSKARPSMTA
jgi:FKBP-type peptidyl-prolyl cis-trans isomerase 2